MAALRVRRPPDHHSQLRGTRPRGTSAVPGQDFASQEARDYRDLLPRDFLRRGKPQNPCSWLRFASGILPPQHLEHHGFFCCCHRVSIYFFLFFLFFFNQQTRQIFSNTLL